MNTKPTPREVIAAHLRMVHSEWMARNPATTPQGHDEMFERFERIGQVMRHDWSSVPGRAYGFMIPFKKLFRKH